MHAARALRRPSGASLAAATTPTPPFSAFAQHQWLQGTANLAFDDQGLLGLDV